MCGENRKEKSHNKPDCKTGNILDYKTRKGVGYMIYDALELDENSKAKTCPVCDNEILDPEGDYCPVCGIYLINECWGTPIDIDNWGNDQIKKNADYQLKVKLAFAHIVEHKQLFTETTFYRTGKKNIPLKWELNKIAICNCAFNY